MTWGEKGLFHLTVHSAALRKARVGSKAQTRADYYFTGLLSLLPLQPSTQGCHRPQRAVPTRTLIINKNRCPPPDLLTGQSGGGKSSVEAPPPQCTDTLIKGRRALWRRMGGRLMVKPVGALTWLFLVGSASPLFRGLGL